MSFGAKPVESVPALPQGEMDALLLGRIKELPVVDISGNNWKGMTIAVMVILAICGAIASSVVLINPEIQSKLEVKADKEKLNLDQVLGGVFSASSFNGSWISDHELIYRDISGNLVKLDVNSQSLTTLVHNLVFRQNIVQKYSLSSDRKYLLLVYDMKKLFRHTYIAKHKIYNIETEETTAVTPPNSSETELQFASWGPKPNSSQLIFIEKNTIYYKESALSNQTKVIVKGNQNDIFNGIPDWVYEEEILSSSNAIWWSPDGSKLCFASFNDTQVDLMQYPWYGSGVQTSNLYTQTIQIRYPKAGRTNPTIKLMIADLDTSDPSAQLQQLTPPSEIAKDDYYFTTLSWVNNQEISVTWLKRSQNYSVISFCPLHYNWFCAKNYEESSKKGWVDMYETPLFTDTEYFLRLPNNETKEGYRHIARVLSKTGDRHFITEGLFDTLQILAISRDELSGIQRLYYASTLPEKPGERHIFSVMITSTRTKTTANCLTCSLGEQCNYNNAIFSDNAKYYVLECNGPQIPKIEIRRTEDNSQVLTLQTNDRLNSVLSNKLLPTIQKMNVYIRGTGNFSVMLYMPPDFRRDEIRKYPLLIQVYGGPGSQMVIERFQINWGTYLASTKNIIYAFIDGRGSGNQGDTLMHQLYLNLGTVEVADQIAVAKYLRDNLSYINKDAIGIWGWSYGGYATALALAMDENNPPVFSCGVSVAPVTSWLLYDSVYTERYMGLPKDNLESYLRSDVLNRANKIKGKKFLLCHGSADDNVHIQQSMVLMKALTNSNVMFQSQVYPDENHALSGVKTHLYKTMEGFWDDCFQLNSFYEDIGLRRRRIVKNHS